MFFGPVMCLYFVVLARAGRDARSSQQPAILAALNPCYAVDVLRRRTRSPAFLALGAVVLAVTGTEALYADMGHFGAHADPPRVALVRDARAGASTTSGRAR